MRKQAAGTLLLLGWALLAGCAATGSPNAPSKKERAAAELDLAEGEALLLLMTDQLLFEPFAVREIFRRHPRLHVQLATALGRIGDPRALPYLESLLEDPVVEVRRAAAFGLGQLGELEAYPNLLGALGDRDRDVGRLAADALARLDLPLERIESALGVLPEVETLARILPALFRFEPDEIHRFEAQHFPRIEAAAGSSTLDREFERWLLFALARSGDARGLPRLRPALASDDPWVRGWAARALGRLGDRSDLEGLHSLLEAAEGGVVVQALRSVTRLIDAGAVAAPGSWLDDLEVLIEDQRSWVRLAAIESVGSWVLEGRVAGRLRDLATSDRGRAGELALLSLARASDAEAEQLIARAASSPTMSTRRVAAEAAAIAGLDSVIERLLADSDPGVRIAALTAVLAGADAPRAMPGADSRPAVVAREALLDSDPGVRTVALEWLGTNPVAPLDELVMGISEFLESRLPDLEVAGSGALRARAAAQPLERGASIAAIERLAESSEYVVRRAAGEALVALGRDRPRLGTVASNRSLRNYREMAESLASVRAVELVTERGRMVISLETRTAPLTCMTFVQLARSGFFDGLDFHRVIADFVAQGGDPRGDGWGGPGFLLRDENSRLPFERGTVGMAKSGPHTAGSQFFLTMSEQPHLNGSYTVLGHVVAGDEALESIEQGDLIVSIREIEFGESD